MTEQVLIGRGHTIRELPRAEWEDELRQTPEHAEGRLAFMSEDHHRIRNMAVVDLARRGRPLTADDFAVELGLDPGRVVEILDDLERRLFFLARNPAGAVSWAYPVTVDQTPHKLIFSTGERLHGA